MPSLAVSSLVSWLPAISISLNFVYSLTTVERITVKHFGETNKQSVYFLHLEIADLGTVHQRGAVIKLICSAGGLEDCMLCNSYTQPRHCMYPPKVNTDNSCLKKTSIIRSDIAFDMEGSLERSEKPDSLGQFGREQRIKALLLTRADILRNLELSSSSFISSDAPQLVKPLLIS